VNPPSIVVTPSKGNVGDIKVVDQHGKAIGDVALPSNETVEERTRLLCSFYLAAFRSSCMTLRDKSDEYPRGYVKKE